MRYKYCFLLASMLMVFFLNVSAVFAAAPDDFVFREIRLGDTKEVMEKKLGEPLFDTDMIYKGTHVIKYTYSRDMAVYLDKDTKKIVEIYTKSKHYVHQSGITYGASKAGMLKVFGKADRRMYEGRIYNIYYNPADDNQRLMLELEPEKSYLVSWTFTALSLEEEPGVIIRHDYNQEEEKPEKIFTWGSY